MTYMKKTSTIGARAIIALCVAVCAMFGQQAFAFDASVYATTSRLSTGRWVKIGVEQNGVYQITKEELSEMGFNDINQVKVYGRGGTPLSEVLGLPECDDLSQVPSIVVGDKICFYGFAVDKVDVGMVDGNINFKRNHNTYSTLGHYFLCENQEARLEPAPLEGSQVKTEGRLVVEHWDVDYHENDLVRMGTIEYMGEEFDVSSITMPIKMKNERLSIRKIEYVSGGISRQAFVPYDIYVQFSAAAKNATSKSTCTFTASILDPNAVGLAVDGYAMTDATDAAGYYYRDANFSNFSNIKSEAEKKDYAVNKMFADGSDLSIKITGSNTATSPLYLDYFFVASVAKNNMTFGWENNQHLFNYANNVGTDVHSIQVAADDNDWVVWSIGSPNDIATLPYAYYTTTSNRYMRFVPGSKSNGSFSYVVFNPQSTMLSIKSYENVENQNLHALATPNLLIITNKTLKPQAERLANIHRQHDDMLVEVVEQDQIFNEFSSGGMDRFAFRRFAKMLYDRSPNTLQNVLLFGPATTKLHEMTDEVMVAGFGKNSHNFGSFVKDDPVAVLADNSTIAVGVRNVRNIGVGRIPAKDEATADVAVRKIEKYINEPLAPWQNRYLASAGSERDNNLLHVFYTESYEATYDSKNSNKPISNFANTAVDLYDIYPKYYNTSSKDLYAASLLRKKLEEGLLYVSYQGHSGSNHLNLEFTGGERIYSIDNMKAYKYSHYPVLATYGCDTTPFYGGSLGFADGIFVENGGFIGVYGTAVSTYSSDDAFMQYHVAKALFDDYGETGTTFGQVFAKAKSTTPVTNTNYTYAYTFFGDPAIKVYFPQNRVAGTVEATEFKAGNTYTVNGVVKNENGATDTSFNGKVTVSLYDKQKKFATITHHEYSCEFGRKKDETFDANYPRELLSTVEAEVANGVWTAKVTVPRQIANEGVDSYGELRFWAVNNEGDLAVNGKLDQAFTLAPINNDQPSGDEDTAGPVMEKAYLNDEEAFALTNQVSANSMLYATFTDESPINGTGDLVGAQPRVIIDGVTYDLRAFTNTTNEGKTANIAYPLSTLAPGHHTLSLSICDIYGNRSNEVVIDFVVMNEIQGFDVTLKTDVVTGKSVAKDEVTFNFGHEVTSGQNFTVKVFDAENNLVWHETTTEYSLTWDLVGSDGNKLAPGTYRYYVSAQCVSGAAGSPIHKFVVF